MITPRSLESLVKKMMMGVIFSVTTFFPLYALAQDAPKKEQIKVFYGKQRELTYAKTPNSNSFIFKVENGDVRRYGLDLDSRIGPHLNVTTYTGKIIDRNVHIPLTTGEYEELRERLSAVGKIPKPAEYAEATQHYLRKTTPSRSLTKSEIAIAAQDVKEDIQSLRKATPLVQRPSGPQTSGARIEEITQNFRNGRVKGLEVSGYIDQGIAARISAERTGVAATEMYRSGRAGAAYVTEELALIQSRRGVSSAKALTSTTQAGESGLIRGTSTAARGSGLLAGAVGFIVTDGLVAGALGEQPLIRIPVITDFTYMMGMGVGNFFGGMAHYALEGNAPNKIPNAANR